MSRIVGVKPLLEGAGHFRGQFGGIDPVLRKPGVTALAFNSQSPQGHAGGCRGWSEVSTIDPVQRSVLEVIEPSVFDQPTNPDAVRVGEFLVGNNDSDNAMVELHFRFGELSKEVGQNGDMAQAVGDTPSVQPVSLDLQRKGRTLPVFRVGRYHIKMSTHKSNGLMGVSNRAARIAQDEIPAAFGIAYPFHLQTAASGIG